MHGHFKKRRTWQFVVDLGLQLLQRCLVCCKRCWTERESLRKCPKCHGPLDDRIERRQEFHTGFATKKGAETALALVAGAMASGTRIQASRLLVRDYLLNEWLPAIRFTIRPTALASQVAHVEKRRGRVCCLTHLNWS